MTARIVVIEDDPAIRLGLSYNLRAESYDVLTATRFNHGVFGDDLTVVAILID